MAPRSGSLGRDVRWRRPASVVAVTDLAGRIAAHLDATLAQQELRGFGTTQTVQRGLAVGGPFAPRIVLTVADVARLAAQAAEEAAADGAGPADPVDPGRDAAAPVHGEASDASTDRAVGYQDRLIEERHRLGELIHQAEERAAAVGPQHRDEIEASAARIPEIGDSPTELEVLAWRAANADRDLAAVRYELAAAEATAAVQDLVARQCEIELRAVQLDHLLYDDGFAAGADEQLAIQVLDVEVAHLDAFVAARTVELARRRLTHMTALHRQLHAALHERRQRTPAG